MTDYCYDTEFLEDGSTIDLISIGVVCEDGREYYAVNSEADWKRIREDDWLMDNVVRHLPVHRGGEVEKRTGFGDKGYSWSGLDMKDVRVKPKWVIANEVREFLTSTVNETIIVDDDNKEVERIIGPFDRPRLWAYYGAYDHVALAQLWGKMLKLPRYLPMFTHELKQLAEDRGWYRDEQLPPKSGVEHDALADARWNMELLRLCREIQ